MKASRAKLAALAALVLCGHFAGTTSAEGSDPSDLFGRAFVSTSVTRDGQPQELAEGTRLRVKFVQEGDRDIVRFHAGCNFFGARVEIADERIDVRRIDGTLIACRNELERQDRRLVRFFGSDPSWLLSGRNLTLATNDTVIELRRKPK